jgi:transposase
MLTHTACDRQRTAATPNASPIRVGVGIDTSRYGHYAAFLRDSQQPAAAELAFAESAQGYSQLHQWLMRIAQQGPVTFHVRLDAAGQYADNLLYFLQRLAARDASAGARALPNATIEISCGDPHRNKNYRAALFGQQKSDPLEARAAARYALSERPLPASTISSELRLVRQIAGRLQATVRQRTRLINQLHHLVALTFPELAMLVKDISLGWVLELLMRYPTAGPLGAATEQDLAGIAYLPHAQVAGLLENARSSIASLRGPIAEELVRDQVRQLRDMQARQKRLENALVSAYRQLSQANYLDTIPGIGEVTAAVLTAFILDIERFSTPGKLVAYFGTLPIEASSGVDREGRPRGPKRYVMSRRGNDLVRRYLWMAALSAVRFNPAVRALYARIVARHPQNKAIAIGHGMRKLLHLVFAIWKSGKPFDPRHYPWDNPAHIEEPASIPRALASTEGEGCAAQAQTAGLKLDEPARKEVTAACTPTLSAQGPGSESPFVDFAHVKGQLPMARVLDHLGLTSRLRGSGVQRRCACPIHRGDGRGRTFSVNLDKQVFHCFDVACGKQGDVIDLWAVLHRMSLRDAALDLVHTFQLEAAPTHDTEKRHG